MKCVQILVVSLLYLHQTFGFENVALGKKAYQIDTPYNANASLAVDGNTNQYFYIGHSCSTTYTDPSPFWYVDLGAIYAIDHVVIYKRMDTCCSLKSNVNVFQTKDSRTMLAKADSLRDVELHIGTSNSSYVQVASYTGILDPISTFQLQIPVKGRWVKISKVGQTGYLTLCEVMVMSTSVVNGRYVKVESQKGSGDVITSIVVRSAILCGVVCYNQALCVGFNIRTVSDSVDLTCDLLDSIVSIANTESELDYFVLSDLWRYT